MNSPVNNLDLETVGDINNPNIPDQTWLFVPGGRPLQEGERLRQPDLARTLRLLAAGGPALFYRGEIGRALVATIQPDTVVVGRDMRVSSPLLAAALIEGIRDAGAVTLRPFTEKWPWATIWRDSRRDAANPSR